jgi:hypothetical protein
MTAQGIVVPTGFRATAYTGCIGKVRKPVGAAKTKPAPAIAEKCGLGVGPGHRMKKLPDRGWIEALTDSNLDCGADARQMTTASGCSV